MSYNAFVPRASAATQSPTAIPSGTYDPSTTASAWRMWRVKPSRSSSTLRYTTVWPCGGTGMSRFSAYHGWSRSRNSTSCPRAVISRTSARYVVACPLPHDDVIERPRMTSERRSDIRSDHQGGTQLAEQQRHLRGTVSIRVLGENPRACGLADA